MKSHFCKAEGTALSYEGECNWCGEKEIEQSEEQAEQKQAELKECRHCGFLCKPNPDESRKWYPLEQPISQEPKSDCPCCGAKSSVLPMAFCRECKSEFWPPQPVRTKDPCNPLQDLTDDEIRNVITRAIKSKLFLGDVDISRAVIAADRAKNNLCERTK